MLGLDELQHGGWCEAVVQHDRRAEVHVPGGEQNGHTWRGDAVQVDVVAPATGFDPGVQLRG